MFGNFNANLRKNEGYLTYIPCIPIPEYGKSNDPLIYFDPTTRLIFYLISVLLHGIAVIENRDIYTLRSAKGLEFDNEG